MSDQGGTTKYLRVGIDGTGAQDGSRVVVRSMEDISKSAGESSSATDSLKNHLDSLGYSANALQKVVLGLAASFATWKLAELARDSALLAARVETLGVVMNAVGKNILYTNSQMDDFAKGVAKMGITTEASRQSVIRMAQANLDMTKSSQMARVAQDAAVIGNINSSEAMEKMTLSVATGQAILAHHMGLMVNYIKAEQDMAASLGKTKEELTNSEMAHARQNEIIRVGAGIAGSYEAAMGTAGKAINSMKRFTDELKLSLGEIFLPSLTAGVFAFTDGLKYVSAHVNEIKGAGSALIGIGLTVFFSRVAASVYDAGRAQVVYAAQLLQGNVVTLGSAQASLQQAAAQVESTQATLAGVNASAQEAIAVQASASSYREYVVSVGLANISAERRALAQRTVLELDGQIAVAEAEITLAVSAESAAQGAAAAASMAHFEAMSAATLGSRALATAQAGLTGILAGSKAAFALVGGEIGLIIIALASLTYAWDKYRDHQAGIDREIANNGASSFRSKLMKENEELAAMIKSQTDTPTQKLGDAQVKGQTTLNQLNRQALTLSMELTAAQKAAATAHSDDDKIAERSANQQVEVLQAKLKSAQIDIAAAPQLIADNKKLLEPQIALQKAKNPTNPIETQYTDVTEEHWKKYGDTLEHMNKQIRDSNPYLDELAKKLTAVDDETNKAIRSTPEYTKSLTAAGEAIKHNITLAHNLAAAIHSTSQEFQGYLDAAGQATPVNNPAGDFNLKNEEMLALVDQLKPTAGLDQLNDQIRKLMGMMDDAPERANEFAAAISRLQANFSKSSGVDALDQGNINMQTALIDDPTERIKKQLDDRYAYERALQEQALDDASADADKRAAIRLRLSLLEQTYDKETADFEKKVLQAQFSEASKYTSVTGQLFSALAGAQDTNSRKGFESAKKYNESAVIMNTASAIMAQFASGGWYAAAAAAAEGAIQYGKVQSTSFGGGSAPSMTAGSAAAAAQQGAQGATSGGSMAGPTSSLQNTLTDQALQGLADSSNNASLAIGKIAANLTKISDILATSQIQLAMGSAPGQGKTVVGADTPMGIQTSGILDSSVGVFGQSGQSLGSLFSGHLVQFDEQLTKFNSEVSGLGAAFGWGASWKNTSNGVQIGMSGGQVSAQDYSEQTKSGGWFGSDKHRTNYSDTDPTFVAALQSALSQVAANIKMGAVATGTTSATDTASLAATNIETAGKTTQEITDEMNVWFTDAANVMADTVVGLKDFTAYGESSYDALVRLSTALQGVNGELNKVGGTLLGSSLKNADAAYNLTQLFGTTEKFTSAVDSYFTSVFTKAQQNTMSISADQNQIGVAFAQMNAAFPGLNAAIPQTRDGFAQLVNGLDLSTTKGQALFKSLMDIAPAFGDLMTLTENANQALLDYNSNLSERNMAAQSLTYSEKLYKLQVDQQTEMTKAIKDGMDTAALAHTQQLEYAKAVSDVFKQALTDTISVQANLLQGLTGIIKSTLSPEALYRSTQASYDQTKALAEQGNKQALSDLVGKANDLLSASTAYNGSNSQYQSDYSNIVATLSSLAGLDTTSPTLEAAQAQLSTLTGIQSALQDGNTAQLLQLQMLVGRTTLMGQYLAAYLSTNPGSGTQTAAQAVAGLPSFAIGSAGLPSDMVAQVHQDEIILDANTSRALQKYGIQVQAADNYRAPPVTDGMKATNSIMEMQLRHLEAIERNTAATVKVLQAGQGRLIEIGEQQAADTAEIKRKARQ